MGAVHSERGIAFCFTERSNVLVPVAEILKFTERGKNVIFESHLKVRSIFPKDLLVGNFNQDGLLLTFQTVLEVILMVLAPPSFSKEKSSGFTSNTGIILSPLTSFLFEKVPDVLTSCSDDPQFSSYNNST